MRNEDISNELILGLNQSSGVSSDCLVLDETVVEPEQTNLAGLTRASRRGLSSQSKKNNDSKGRLRFWH